MGLASGNLFDRSDVREGFDVTKGYAISIVSSHTGVGNAAYVVYTVPEGRKFILNALFVTENSNMTVLSDFTLYNANNDKIWKIAFTGAGAVNQVTPLQLILGAGCYFVHNYNTADGGGKSAGSILGTEYEDV